MPRTLLLGVRWGSSHRSNGRPPESGGRRVFEERKTNDPKDTPDDLRAVSRILVAIACGRSEREQSADGRSGQTESRQARRSRSTPAETKSSFSRSHREVPRRGPESKVQVRTARPPSWRRRFWRKALAPRPTSSSRRTRPRWVRCRTVSSSGRCRRTARNGRPAVCRRTGEWVGLSGRARASSTIRSASRPRSCRESLESGGRSAVSRPVRHRAGERLTSRPTWPSTMPSTDRKGAGEAARRPRREPAEALSEEQHHRRRGDERRDRLRAREPLLPLAGEEGKSG
jgi:hypothetical protein